MQTAHRRTTARICCPFGIFAVEYGMAIFDESTIYLLDSYGLIYRSYFAFIAKPLLDSRGHNVSALFGFFRNLHAVLTHYHPRYFVAALDSRTKTFRHDLFPEYKATRQKTPDDLHAQIPWIEDILLTIGIPTIRVDGYEADDVIATIATAATERGRTCRILSGDKDLMQLVSDTTQILKPEKGEVWKVVGAAGVQAEWGQPPEKMLDLLSLVGDTADNVPGISGIGPKTACKLLDQYGSLDGILAHSSEIKGAVGEKIRNGKDDALFSKKLIQLCTDVPGEHGTLIEQVQPVVFDYRAAAKKLQSYAAPTVARQYERLAEAAGGTLRPAQSADSAPHAGKPESVTAPAAPDKPIDAITVKKNCGTYRAITDIAGLKKIISAVLNAPQKAVALDCETDSLLPWHARLLGFSLCTQAGTGVYVPIVQKDALFSDGVPHDAAIAELARLFNEPAVTVIMHNGKLTTNVFARQGYRWHNSSTPVHTPAARFSIRWWRHGF